MSNPQVRSADRVRIDVDVTGLIPIQGDHHISTWIFPPPESETSAEDVPLLFCIPGGTYTKAYWHLEVPGLPGYSFAEHLAAQGMLVIAVDNLGTGDSSRHPRAAELTPDVVAEANSAVVTELGRRATSGSLSEVLPPLRLGKTIGVGHSMGAMLTIFQQSLFNSFDAIVPLGYGCIGPIMEQPPEIGRDGNGLPSREAIMRAAQAGAFDDMPLADRSLLIRHFYWEDVPAEVISADSLTNTSIPGVCGLLSVTPFIVSDHAGRVRCPVFIGLGERDSTLDHPNEARAYFSSDDVTLYRLRGSAHCHNMNNPRQKLWNRLAGWIRALEP